MSSRPLLHGDGPVDPAAIYTVVGSSLDGGSTRSGSGSGRGGGEGRMSLTSSTTSTSNSHHHHRPPVTDALAPSPSAPPPPHLHQQEHPPTPPAHFKWHSAHPDRGSGWSQAARLRTGAAALVESGRHAGRPSVSVVVGGGGDNDKRNGRLRRAFSFSFSSSLSSSLTWHSWARDPFGTLLAMPWRSMLAVMSAAYILSFLAWAGCWYWLWLRSPHCVLGFETSLLSSSASVNLSPAATAFVSAFLLSVEAQQTIGWGARAPRSCVRSAALETCQVVFGQLLTAVCAGVVFARVSHPRRRARSVFVSESACVARKKVKEGGDSSLPVLSFRVADTKQSRDGGPEVTAHLFRWLGDDDDDGDGDGGDGENDGGNDGGETSLSRSAVSTSSSSSSSSSSKWRVDQLELTDKGKLPPLLLPFTVEHAIGPSSPLAGLSLDDLLNSGAEVVVQVKGSSDRGGEFVVTRSYLACELHWGCEFAPCVRRAAAVVGGGGSGGGGGSSVARPRQRRAAVASSPPSPSSSSSKHVVDLSRFHEVVPLPGVARFPRNVEDVAAEVLGVGGGGGGGGRGSTSRDGGGEV